MKNHLLKCLWTTEKFHKNISLDYKQKNEQGFTLLEILATIMIISIIVSGVLFIYQFNFLTVNETINNSNRFNSILSIETEISQSLLSYNALITVREDGNQLTVDDQVFTYDVTKHTLSVVKTATTSMYGDIFLKKEEPFFKLSDDNRSVEVSFDIINRTGEKEFRKLFLVRNGMFDKDYMQVN